MAGAKTHITRWLSCLMLGLGAPALLEAQPLPAREEPLRLERVDGLTHNTVFAITQDHEGFLWAGTADGLSRYDGYEFITYRHSPEDPTSLAHNTVRALLVDRQGTLWIGTEAGLDAFDPHAGHFVHYTIDGGGPETDKHGFFRLLEDPSGRLWIGANRHIIRYDPVTRRAHHFRSAPEENGPDLHTAPFSLSLDTTGVLWVGAGGLWHYEAKAGLFVNHPLSGAQGSSLNVHAGPSGTLWISAQDAVGSFAPGTARFLPLVPGVSGHILLEQAGGLLWAGGPHGLVRIDPDRRTVRRVELEHSADWLSSQVRALYEDRAGTIWVGTLGGLYRFDPFQKPFVHLEHNPEDPGSLSSNIVMAFHEGIDGSLWVGTLGGGLNRVDGLGGAARPRITRYLHRPGDPGSLCHDNIWALHEDRQRRLWLGTDGGLCILDQRTGRFTRHVLNPQAPPYVNVIAEDQEGQLWIGGARPFRLDPRTGTVESFSNKDNWNIQAIYPAASGTVWLGTEFSGLWRLDPLPNAPRRAGPPAPAASRLTAYPILTQDPNGLLGKAVRVIHPDPDGRTLWLGTDMGLVRFDPETGGFRHYLQRDGLPGSNVYGILPDAAGRLWISTNDGLARFDPARETFRVFDAADGTGNTEYNRRAAYRRASGEFVFGGLAGLTAFYPEAIRDNPYVPPVALTRVQTSSRHGVAPGSAYQAMQEGLVIEPGDLAFSFEFAALSFTDAPKNRYAYQLEGLDVGWIDAGPRRFARYVGVPPGRYTFRVRAANSDGLWNEDGLAMPVFVRPTFWQTWWFRGLLLLAVIGLLGAAYRYRVAQLMKLERMRLRIAADLHDDIGAGLGSIAILSDVVRRQEALPEPAQHHLTTISQAARHLADNLRDIVWLVNPEHDGLDDLLMQMRGIAGSLLNGTAYTFHTPDVPFTAALDMEFRRHLLLSYKEMLHNVARHAHARHVAIRIDVQDQALCLTVTDDGAGFEPSSVAGGHGLKSLQHRASLLGGTVALESTPGRGTTVRFTAKTT